MPSDPAKPQPIVYVPAILAACVVLSLILDPIWAEKYGLFHTVLEIICVIIAASTFTVLWISEKTGHTNHVLAIGFLAVAIFGLFHIIHSNALAYYPPGYFDLGTRYWVLGRFTEALFLVLSTTALNKAIHNKYLASFSTVVVAVATGVVLYNSPHIFPVLLTPQGPTPVKIIIEYVIIALFLLYLYRVHTGKIGDNIIQKNYIIMAVGLAVPSEFCFTLYSTYDFFNLLGYILRVVYYHCLLRAIVEGYVLYPYKALKFSENMFSKTFHGSNAIMSLSRLRDGTHVDLNSAWATALGYSREDLIGRSVNEFNIWTDPAQREKMVEQLKQEGHLTDFESRYRKRSGELGYTLSTIDTVDIDGEKHVLVSAHDITEKVGLQRDLRLSNEKFASAFYNNQAMMSIFRLRDGVYVDVNQAWASFTGYEREEMIGRTGIELDLWAEPIQREALVQELRQDKHIPGREFRCRNRSGDTCFIAVSRTIIDIYGEEHILSSAIDITEMRKAGEERIQSLKLFRQVFNSIPLLVLITSLNDDRVVEVNDEFLARGNITREALIGLKHDQVKMWADPIEKQQYEENLRLHGAVKNFEFKHLTASGEIRTMLVSGTLILWAGEECRLSIANDITELKAYEKELSRLANFNVMGQMAGSIAHEVRNPMTAVKGFLQLFQEQEKYQDDLYAFDIMIEEMDRVNEIISTFLSLAQMNILDMQIGSLNDSITDILPLIRSDALLHDINMDTRLGTVPEVRFDKGEIRQLAINLIRNAVQAMPLGGTLTIRTFADDLGVNLEIQDEGGGIPPQVIAKMGTPFVTTRKNGSGLGMAVCYSIAQRHDARITYDTSPAGTSFKVTFPAAS